MTEFTGPPDVTFVDASTRVDAALRPVDAEVVGVDVERADADLYFRRAALIQVGIPGHCVLLDGTTMEAMPQLDDFLGPGRLAVLHAMENDLVPLAAKAVHPDRLADTAVAAALLGLPTGLVSLLAEVLDVHLDGDKNAFQRADWAERPLPDDMAAYAAGDVVHLPALWSELADRLEASGRRAWYDEELTARLNGMDDDQRDWTRVKGSGKLTPQERAVLKAVWEEREALAREHDIAPNRLVHDDVLRDLATEPPRTEAQLVRRSRRRRSLLREHASRLLAAVEAGLDAPAQTSSSTRTRRRDDRDVYDALRKRRAQVAEDIGIDAGVLAPSRPLWQAVVGDPADASELCALAGLSRWRSELLAEPLWETYLDVRAQADHDGADGAGGATDGDATDADDVDGRGSGATTEASSEVG